MFIETRATIDPAQFWYRPKEANNRLRTSLKKRKISGPTRLSSLNCGPAITGKMRDYEILGPLIRKRIHVTMIVGPRNEIRISSRMFSG